jgi:hypothetical protein
LVGGIAVRKLKILLRMLRNRLTSGDPTLRNAQTSRLDLLVFVLNFFPPYNLACWLWIKASVRWAGAGFVTTFSWFLMRRGFLFGALRHLSPEDRSAFAQAILLPSLKAANPAPTLSPQAREMAATLATTGYVSLGSLLSRPQAEAAVNYFRLQKGYASQTPLQSDGVLRPLELESQQDDESDRYFCFSSKTSLACPQVAALVDHPVLREVAAAYLGFTPLLYSVNTLATANGSAEHYVMRMHRDYDAFASVTFFVCWTDVAADNGATIYIPNSHLRSDVDQFHPEYLTGEAGQVYGVDTFGLHSGNRNVKGLRLATWIRFGTKPNLGTIQDPDLVPDYRPRASQPLTAAPA